ncbi:MAG: hypothetical protein KDK62_05435 [Chlamydiia bacterium]|nr:hypothetical protein [Chlamydiia bacterium]
MSVSFNLTSFLLEIEAQRDCFAGNEEVLNITQACQSLLKGCEPDQPLSSESAITVDKTIKAWADAYWSEGNIKEASRLSMLGSDERHQMTVTMVLVSLNGRFQNNLGEIADYFERAGDFPGRESFVWRSIYQIVPQTDVIHMVRFLKMTMDVTGKETYVRSRSLLGDARQLLDGFNESTPEERGVKYKLLAETVLSQLPKANAQVAWEYLSETLSKHREGFIEGCFLYVREQPALVRTKLRVFMSHDKAKEEFLNPVLERYLLSPGESTKSLFHYLGVLALMTKEGLKRAGLALAQKASTPKEYDLLKQIIYKLLSYGEKESVIAIAKTVSHAETSDHIVSQLLRDKHNPFEIIPLIKSSIFRVQAIESAYKTFLGNEELQRMKDCLELFKEGDFDEDYWVIRCLLDTALIRLKERPVETVFMEVWCPIEKVLDRNSFEFLSRMAIYFDEESNLFNQMMGTLSNFPLFRSKVLKPFLDTLNQLKNELQIPQAKINILIQITQKTL